ncbi:MAG: replication protein [Thermomicrobiales bacterium]
MPRLKSTSSTFRFAGVTSPNTTQVPDQYLDELLPILSGGELKVLLYITRRTFGFKKASDNISLSQMLNGIRTQDGRQLDSGVGLTKKTLLQAIRSLETQNIIVTERRRSKDRETNRPATG